MVIYIEDYMKRRRPSSTCVRPRLVAAGGAGAAAAAQCPARTPSCAATIALPLGPSGLAAASAAELASLYAEATLV
jgi:hypothetical protein